MSIAARDWALRQDLKPVPKFVLVVLADAANTQGVCWPRISTLWVHGHMHDPFDYEIYGTRVVCNPRGYAPNSLTPEFRPDWVVEV